MISLEPVMIVSNSLAEASMALMEGSSELLSYPLLSGLAFLGHLGAFLTLPLQSLGSLIPSGGMTAPGCHAFGVGNMQGMVCTFGF